MEDSLTQAAQTAPVRAPTRLLSLPFMLVTAATLAYFFGVGATLPVFPRYVEEALGGSAVGVGIVVGAFGVTAVVLRPLAGRWSDRSGRRWLLVAGAAVVGVSVAGYHVAANVPVLVLMRLVTGAGEAAFWVAAAAVVGDLAPAERRGEAVSLFSLALYGGLAIGPLVGEALFVRWGFGPVWGVSAAACLVAAAVATATPETRPEEVAAAGSGGAGGFVHRRAMLPGAALAAIIWGLAAYTTFMPLYAVDVGLSGSRYLFLLYAGIVLVIRSAGSRLPDRLGPGRAGSLSLSATAAGLLLIAAWTSPAGLYAGTALFAVGQGLGFPALMTVVVNSALPAERGAAVGTFMAFFDLAFALGPITLGWVAHGAGYGGVFVASAAITLLGLVPLAAALRQARAAP
jgi:MFS family permease